MKLKVKDTVLIIKGKDRGKTGEIEKVLPALGKIQVKGINLVKKHLKPSRQNPRGGIIEKAVPLNAVNVMAICPHCSKPNRPKSKGEGKNKHRVCGKCEKGF